jgi:hypothetical protein
VVGKKNGLIVAKGKLSQALPVVQVRNIGFVEWVLFTQSFHLSTSCMPLLTLGSIVDTSRINLHVGSSFPAGEPCPVTIGGVQNEYTVTGQFS